MPMTFIARIAETHLLPPILRCQRFNRSKAEIAAKSLIVSPYRFAMIAETGELWIMLWLLIKGAKVQPLVAIK